jgi:hypothetical protein
MEVAVDVALQNLGLMFGTQHQQVLEVRIILLELGLEQLEQHHLEFGQQLVVLLLEGLQLWM